MTNDRKENINPMFYTSEIKKFEGKSWIYDIRKSGNPITISKVV